MAHLRSVGSPSDRGEFKPVMGSEQEAVERFGKLLDHACRYRIFYVSHPRGGTMFGCVDIGMNRPISSPTELIQVMDGIRSAHPDNADAILTGWARYDDPA